MSSTAPNARCAAVALREDLPALVPVAPGSQPVAYLDAASTTPRPRRVIEAVARTLGSARAGTRRGLHAFSAEAEQALEAARLTAARHLGAADSREVIFTRGATQALNALARGLARSGLCRGDEVLVTELEHHSNLLPWRAACEQSGATLRVAPVRSSGELDLEAAAALIGPRTRLVSLSQVAAPTGEELPVRRLADLAHGVGALVIVDAALALGHLPPAPADLGADLLVASGHKAYGPAGIGLLHGRLALLERLDPLELGGDMVRAVRAEHLELAAVPERHEAGTPNIEAAAGLAAALEQLAIWGRKEVVAHEAALVRHATESLAGLPGVSVLARAARRVGVVSFAVEGVHPHDLATLLDSEGVLVRAGNLCAQPFLDRLGLQAATRASFGAYSTMEDVERLVRGVGRAIATFR